MRIIFENENCLTPKVSIILLDWSCRESFHSVDYLNKQTVAREQYELIWIEYYGSVPGGLESKIKKADASSGSKPLLDKWIVMDMPDDLYYHKHLMYNIGIIAGKGNIICICDSDAVFSPTFVESIIGAFEKSSDIVLHLDEVRNVSEKFYPFNYPQIKEILEGAVINWNKSKSITDGLLDNDDYLFTRNYGACFCAKKTDIISIGGSDEDLNYLGHVCGPYELTFRLINYGLKEVWHQKEFIYHVWHPGTDGHLNFAGPNVKNMSLIALEALHTGRVMPLTENNIIKELRLSKSLKYSNSLNNAVNPEYFETFNKKNIEKNICFDVLKNSECVKLIDVCEDYNFNIIKINNDYYGVPCSLGVISYENYKEKINNKEVIKGENIEHIKTILKKQKEKEMQTERLEISVRSHDIILKKQKEKEMKTIKNFIKNIPIIGGFARWIYRFIKMPNDIQYLVREISDVKTVNYNLLNIINSLNSDISGVKRDLKGNKTCMSTESSIQNKNTKTYNNEDTLH